MRVKLMAMLGNVRIPLQVDVGAGDAVVPPPEILDYPGLLDLPRARIRAYRPETSIAEKTEAMVRLALANSRMKDFFDIHRLAETRTFDGETMRLAVAATFTRRGIEIPGERPLALTSEFADDAQKRVQWAAFVRRARRPELADLSAIIATLDRFLWPVLQAAARREAMAAQLVERRPVEGVVGWVSVPRLRHAHSRSQKRWAGSRAFAAVG